MGTIASCVKSPDFNRLEQADARARLLARIMISEHERAEGLGTDAFEATNNLRAKYGLQHNHSTNSSMRTTKYSLFTCFIKAKIMLHSL